MIITLPKPPSINHLYGRNGHRTFIGAKGKAWFEEAGYALIQQCSRRSIKKDVAMYIKLYVCGRYDYDNCLKALNDLFTKVGVIKDDELIMFAQIEKVRVKHRKEEKVEVELDINY